MFFFGRSDDLPGHSLSEIEHFCFENCSRKDILSLSF